VGQLACMAEKITWKPEYMWEDRITMDFKIIWYGRDFTGSAKGPVAGSCEHSNERDFIKCTEFLDSMWKC